MAESTRPVDDTGSLMSASGIRIPADFEPHSRTVMAWAVHREWGADRERVENELDTVIRTIAEDEPVTLLTPPDLIGAARARGFGAEVEIMPAPVDDIWMRDIAPVFAHREDEIVAIDLNFNAWDGTRGSRSGDRLARTFDFGVPVIGVPFVGEGGGFITDGKGLVVATRSCLLSRNPHLAEEDVTRAFRALGMHTTIWLEGDQSEPITTGHPDGYLAFLPDGGLLVESMTRGRGRRSRARDIARLRRDAAEGRLSRLVCCAAPDRDRLESTDDSFAATYLNLFVTRGSVLTARLGDLPADFEAERRLAPLFGGRDIRMLGVNALLRGGGGIRCLTQPTPAQ
ncbi:agmatine deiminase [Bradyrhizobium erythrophlei]|nr:agmatine deiminase [Bradyrhizobium erythrophlei]